MGKKPAPNEQRVVLEQVSWQKYETLLTEMTTQRTSRFTFDRGRLEMMNPLEEHDRGRKLIESLILVLVEELQLSIASYVAPTLKRQDLQCGIEPDACYYIQHEAQVQGLRQPDLATDPPPDLVQDVSMTKSSLNRLTIYAALGIPEVWQYVNHTNEEFTKGKFLIYCLQGDRYVESLSGFAFPFLPATKVLEFIEQSDTLGLMTALKLLQAWIQEAIS